MYAIRSYYEIFPGVRTYRFGIIAVYRKHITLDQVKHALAEQVEDNVMGRPHRLLGDILRDNGWMTEGQMKAVLVKMGVERDLVTVE